MKTKSANYKKNGPYKFSTTKCSFLLLYSVSLPWIVECKFCHALNIFAEVFASHDLTRGSAPEAFIISPVESGQVVFQNFTRLWPESG